MDNVFIKELQLSAIIGCLNWERKIKQTLLLDLELAVDCKAISLTDDLKDAIDYAALSHRVQDYVSSTSFKLIETLAQHIADLIQKEFSVTQLKLTLYKPGALPSAHRVGITIER